MTRIPPQALVMVGDGARAIFFRNTGSALEPNLTVEKVFEQENPATRDQGTDRPTRAADHTGGWASSGGSPRSHIEQTDWHQLNEDRFAKEIAEKLYQLAHMNHYKQLVVVAPPKVLGVLRQALHKEVLERVVEEVPKELTRAPTAVIQKELIQLLSG